MGIFFIVFAETQICFFFFLFFWGGGEVAVGFFGISNLVGYLKPNSVYTYVLNMYDL